MITVAEVLEAARDYHASLDDRIHPDQLGVRFLDRYQKRLVLKIVQINPDELAATQTIALPLADFVAGEAALDAHQYMSGKAVYLNATDLYDRLEKLPWESRDRRVAFPAYSWQNGQILLHGQSYEWLNYSELQLRYVPMTVTLATPASVFTLPDTALDCLSVGLAHFFLRRQPEQPYKTYFAELRQEWMDAERAFLGEIAGRAKFNDSAVNEVW